MAALALGLLILLGAHSIRIFGEGWRAAQIRRLGALRWKLLYSLASLAGLLLVVWGFSVTQAAPLVVWSPPHWTRHLAALLVLSAFILVAAAYVPGNHLKAWLGHPMIAGIKVWAFAHLLANGTAADILLFGAILVWAAAAFAAARRRDRAAGTRYAASGFARDLLVIAIGVVAWALFAAYGHEWLIGVRPFG